MIKTKENISVWYEGEEDFSIDQIYEQYIIVKDFFDMKEDLEIRIILCSKKEDLMFFTGLREINEFTLGRAMISLNLIAMYSPEAIEKNTPKSRHNFRGAIAHEIAHLFYNKKNYSQRLQLLNEGIASYIQWSIINKKDFNQDIKIEDIDILQEYSKDIYKKGLFLVDLIIKSAGKEKLIEFLDIIKDCPEERIREKFNKFINIELKGGIEDNGK
ncbi:MAG: hypothetical protein NTZ83_02415 [Candidatus Pacearchaeota archaeon]|nr:hypothetical protein [Candidatus Pacearchaeota archaeon]